MKKIFLFLAAASLVGIAACNKTDSVQSPVLPEQQGEGQITFSLAPSDGDVPMTDELRAKIMEQNKAMADDALRVMAAARTNYRKNPPESYEAADLEQNMTFIGLCGMIDPVRP